MRPLLILVLLASSAAAAPPVVQLDAWGTDSVRVRIAPPGGEIVDPPFGALLVPHPTQRSSASSTLSISNGNLVVTTDPTTGFINATRLSDGALLFTTSAIAFGAPAIGSRPGSVSASIVLLPSALAVPNKVYGLGEHRTGQLDMTGYSKLMQDSQYYGQSSGADILIPFYMVSPLNVGILWNLPSYGAVDLGPHGHNWTSFATLNVDFWVTTTPAPVEKSSRANTDPASNSPLSLMLANYVDAVGHAAPMPPYVAGFWQCKNRYRNQSQVLAVAQGYRDHGLPIDIITIDYMHWTNFGDWSFNPICWPDPAAMVQQLQDMGIELAVTFWPYVTPAGAYYSNFTAAGFFANNLSTGVPAPVESWAGPMYLTDESNPAARAAIYAAFKAGYGRFGIRTVWLDGSEPERSTAYNFGQFSLAGGTDNEIGEAWIQQHVRAMAEGFASDGYAPNEFFLLPRSTWAGVHTHSAGVWSGDIHSTFDELAIQVRVAQGMGLSGHAVWTNDGGGYGGGNPADPVFQDLIVRWLQASTFFPIMRLHGERTGGPPPDECGATNGDNEIWNLASDEAHYNAMAATAQLRSSLRDYTLTINAVTVATGLPMVRAMVLAFPDDPNCTDASVEGQWMYGPDFLVAPVTLYQATSWTIYLPLLSSSHWVYYWNGSDAGAGGYNVTVNVTDIADYPLFVRTPLPPPVPTSNVTAMYSATRADVVTCVSQECFAEQVADGNYTVLSEAEALAWLAPGPITIGTASYDTIAITNFWSATLTDNADSVSGPPDASYTVSMPNGYALTSQAPGTIPLLQFFREYSGTHVDTATFASPAGVAWASAHGYAANGTLGFVLPAPSAARISA